MFRKIKGQSTAVQILKAAIDNDRISQAYLFQGIEGIGKFTTALYFGMALNCLSKSEYRPCGVCNSCRKFLAFDHPDFIYVFPTPNLQYSPSGEIKSSDGQKQYESYIRNKIDTPWHDYNFNSSVEIRKESISILTRRLDVSKFEARYRVCIIEKAEQMNITTSNAFLRTLEEPPEATIIILVSSRPSMLLPTITSRCQSISFQPVAPVVIESILTEDYSASPNQARTISRIADGSVKQAIYLSQVDSTEIRNLAFDMFLMGSQDGDLAFYKALHSPSFRINSDNVVDLLRYLSLFVGDLSILQNAPDHLVNIDKLEEIHNVLDAMSFEKKNALSDSVCKFMLDIEDLHRKISGNVNLHLVLMNMFVSLNRVFRD